MSSARRYFARAPRYVFQSEDGTLVRFAPMETKGIISRAVIRDLSETGLCFTLPITEDAFHLPEEGAPLKIEFPVPGSPKGVACFATVVRVEQRSEWIPEWGERGFHLIALKFRHLPTLHSKAIKRSLHGRTDDENEIHLDPINPKRVAAFVGIAFALTVCAYALTFDAHGWVELGARFFHRFF